VAAHGAALFAPRAPALAPFLGAVRRLEAAGFAVAYDGMGTWDAGPTWPGRTDALVFCARDV